jgi:hypothetical protein
MNRLPDLAAVSARQSGQEKMTIPVTEALSRLPKLIENRACQESLFVMELRTLGKKPCKLKQPQICGFGCCPPRNW